MIGGLIALALVASAPGQADCARGKGSVGGSIELPRGRWDEEVYAALVRVMRARGASSASWDPCARPLAVFDWDNTIIAGDIGDAALAAALDAGLLAPDGEALEEILAPLSPAHAEALRASWPRAKWRAPAEPPSELKWRVLRAYQDLCRERGSAVCYPWLTQVYAGWTEVAQTAFAERTIAGELAREPGAESVMPTEDPVTVERGVRVRPEMVALIGALEGAGFDVFVVTASPEWLVRAFAPRVGLTADRVIGMRAVTTSTGATAKIDPPITYRAGKVAAIRTRVPPGGRVPTFVAGDALTDLEMLEEASGLALFIDRGDATVRARAEARGWAVQRPFELAPVAAAPKAKVVVKPRR